MAEEERNTNPSDLPNPSVIYPSKLEAWHVDPNARLFADRDELIKALHQFKGGRIAEIGVAFGDFSRVMLDVLEPSRFDAFDLFWLHNVPTLWHRPSADTFKGATHREFYAERFKAELEAGRLFIFEGDSSEELGKQQAEVYDLIYIDADHGLEAVKKDVAAAVTKLKPDGLLIFNDYLIWDYVKHEPYGVVQVVNDLCVEDGWIVTHFALEPGMWCDIAICRQKRGG